MSPVVTVTASRFTRTGLFPTTLTPGLRFATTRPLRSVTDTLIGNSPIGQRPRTRKNIVRPPNDGSTTERVDESVRSPGRRSIVTLTVSAWLSDEPTHTLYNRSNGTPAAAYSFPRS